MRYVCNFNDLSMADIDRVGGKNASLGEMIRQLGEKGILVPPGFAITANAYWHILEQNNLIPTLKKIIAPLPRRQVKHDDLPLISRISTQARTLIEKAQLPNDVAEEIIAAYKKLGLGKEVSVAIRSSATAEDLPGASFAGQQETYLNVTGEKRVLHSIMKCISSLFTERAIIYRIDKGFDHFKVAMSVGVQIMVRSDLGVSGVAFSIDTESGFKDVVIIEASYGLGETIVQGEVIPDQFYVHKPTLAAGYRPIIRKSLGSKEVKRIYAKRGVKTVSVPQNLQHQFCLLEDEILLLARQVAAIEKLYSRAAKRWQPMDVEWAKDGNTEQIYIIQARPETVHGTRKITSLLSQERLKTNAELKTITTGESIGQKIAAGKARVIATPAHMKQLKPGEILITHMTNPDWVPVMKIAAGIITTSGGRTCHAAIVSRELGIPAIVGAIGAMKLIKTGDEITVDCSKGQTGYIYQGLQEIVTTKVDTSRLKKLPVELLVNISMPDTAFVLSFLPVDGVGLARTEFIIADAIDIHPMAIVQPKKIKSKRIVLEMQKKAYGYPSLRDFYIDKLAEGIGTIAAAFYPRPVCVRFSDFKSDEYRNLLGGNYFEAAEENPMLGLRGASRYYSEHFSEAFGLECAAIKKARLDMGFKNINVLIPFVRTIQEAKKVLAVMAEHGLKRKVQQLKVFMMVEVPSDVFLIDQASKHFDGFSIGSNDLTQLTLAVDRDSPTLAPLFDERAEPVQEMLRLAICAAQKNKKYISICGQAPSDYPELANHLICLGISAISLNEDSILPFLVRGHTCRKRKGIKTCAST